MIVIPDKLILQTIEPQKVYYDKKSVEQSTKIIKRKYKMAGNSFASLSIYTFFIITSKQASCSHGTMITVEQHHWENKDPACLNENYSYIDIKKIEQLTGAEICAKKNDSYNGFKFVAKLCDDKYNDLKTLLPFISTGGYISCERRELARQALADTVNPSEVSDDVMRRLGLLG